MPLNIYFKNNTRLDQKNSFQKKAQLAIKNLSCDNAYVELSFVGKSKIQMLNHLYRKKNKVTDVLSFPLEKEPPPSPLPWHLGEIVICMPVARKQAKEAGLSLRDQCLRLFVHGLVHLKGYDHELGKKAFAEFRKMEVEGLKKLFKQALPL